jgi:hypothetical protein
MVDDFFSFSIFQVYYLCRWIEVCKVALGNPSSSRHGETKSRRLYNIELLKDGIHPDIHLARAWLMKVTLLTIKDCWKQLQRGKACGIARGPTLTCPTPVTMSVELTWNSAESHADQIGNEKSYCKGKNDDWIIYPLNKQTQVQQ